MQTRRNVIDVSHLPSAAFDWHSPLWWGNLLMIFIETSTVLLLLASYYHIARNYETWPPPRPDYPYMVDSRPDWRPGTLNTILLVGSCLPMYLGDRAARKLKRGPTIFWLAVMTLVSGASTWIRFHEFSAIHFSWADNAYASIVWTTLGLHLFYILGALGEFLIMWIWIMTHPLDDKHALDVTLAGGYWYWLAGMWVLIYVTIYFAPKFL